MCNPTNPETETSVQAKLTSHWTWSFRAQRERHMVCRGYVCRFCGGLICLTVATTWFFETSLVEEKRGADHCLGQAQHKAATRGGARLVQSPITQQHQLDGQLGSVSAQRQVSRKDGSLAGREVRETAVPAFWEGIPRGSKAYEDRGRGPRQLQRGGWAQRS